MKRISILNLISYGSLVSVLILALSACSTSRRAQVAGAVTRGASGVAEVTGPNEAEILHVISTINDSEIEAAQLAKSKSKNDQVVELASQLIEDHRSNNKKLMEVAQKMDLKPNGNEISKSIKAGRMMTMSSLKHSSGAEFDQGYLTQQVKMHQTALDTIDKHLMPNAQNSDLKSFLEATRASIVSHLDHAQSLESGTEKTGE